MYALLLALLLSLYIGPARAGEDYDFLDHLTDCAADSDSTCVFERGVLREQWPQALAGHYPSQRNVAFCLSNGCYGAVRVDRVLACAWRIVILGSGVPQIEDSDRANYSAACRFAISPDDLEIAKDIAWRLFIRIYGHAPDPTLKAPVSP